MEARKMDEIKKEPESPLQSDQGYSTDTSYPIKYETPASPILSTNDDGKNQFPSSQNYIPTYSNVPYQQNFKESQHDYDVAMESSPYQYNESLSNVYLGNKFHEF